MHVQAPAQGGQDVAAQGVLLPPQVPVNSSASSVGASAAAASLELADQEEPDEEQLKRILACKRLSEGNCNRHLANLCRKNSLHFIGESLPPVTEGEPMRHMSHHMSQNGMEGSQSSSTSSSSLRGTGKHLTNKRNSQDDNTNSCSSSTSLDCSGGGPRSPTRRRSSTVSQCSSVLSEGTRQQLNFDLSPDLAPDSSILEANALSPTDFDRPASPEPLSLGSGDGSFDMRPISRMSSQFCDDPLTTEAPSPDSTLGDSTENTTANTEKTTHEANTVTQLMIAMRQQQQQQQQRTKDNNERAINVTLRQQPDRSTASASPPDFPANETNGSGGGGELPKSEMMTSEKWTAHGQRHQQQLGSVQLSNDMTNVADNLERIITHVSEVKVSSNTPADQLDRRLMETGSGEQHGQQNHQNQQQQQGDYLGDCLAMSAGQKRAHTPFGSNIQRNKATHTEFRG